MKIYNKKKFADGCFFLVLGAALAGAIIWKRREMERVWCLPS